MKIKLDENIPNRLTCALQSFGHAVDTVLQEGLTGRSDDEIWEAVQREKAFFITQDLDFSDVRKFIPGTHSGLLLIRLREPGRDALFYKVLSLFESENIEDWNSLFVVATEHKIRIRRPGQNDL